MTGRTFTSLLTCAGGADEGARQAGLSPLFGFEIDARYVRIAQENDHPCIQADVTAVDYTQYPAPWWLHASPVCTRISKGNSAAKECQLDTDVARAIVRAIAAWTPEVVSIENVVEYSRSTSLNIIVAGLARYGYEVTIRHVDCWRYGVPQTRRRLILVARRGQEPRLPEPDADLFTPTWNRALEDLLPTLPDTTLVPWQQPYWDEWTLRGEPAYIVGGNPGKSAVFPSYVPAPTVVGSRSGNPRIWVPERACFVQTNTACLSRLQTFPDDYAWPGVRKDVHTAIGNAVPPELMRRIINANL